MAILEEVREAAEKRLLFLPHAIRQMSRPQRMISSDEVEVVVAQGELIEDYPSDPTNSVRGEYITIDNRLGTEANSGCR